MKRLTRRKDKYPCRAKRCAAEVWMMENTGVYSVGDVCKNCPFEKYINALAAYEDEIEGEEE